MDSGGERGKDDEFSLGHVCGLVEHPRKNFPMTHDYRYLAYSRDYGTEDEKTGNVVMYRAAECCLQAKEGYIE